MMRTWENCNDRAIAFFVSEPDKFKSSIRGISWLEKQDLKSSTFKQSGDFIIEDLKEFDKFKGAKILVVGGGPSSNEVDWDFDDYDYVFSCNHFYKSQKLKDKKIDLFFVGNEVDTTNEEFLTYCKRHNSLIGIEDLEHRPSHIKNIINNFKDNSFLCSCRYQSKFTGIAAKIVLLALTFEAKHVDFVGLDGVAPGFNCLNPMPHSFEGNKLFRKNKQSSYKQVRDHYIHFENYIKKNFPNVIINNLGKQSAYNYAYETNI